MAEDILVKSKQLHQPLRCHAAHTPLCQSGLSPWQGWLRVTGHSWASCQPDISACLKRAPKPFGFERLKRHLCHKGFLGTLLTWSGRRMWWHLLTQDDMIDNKVTKTNQGWSQYEEVRRDGGEEGFFLFGLMLTVLTCCGVTKTKQTHCHQDLYRNRLCSSWFYCPSSVSLGETGFRQTWQGVTTSQLKIPMHFWLSF